MTLEQFGEEIYKLKETFSHRDLEEYLSAMYKNLNDNMDVYIKEKPSLELVLCILKESFTSLPASFEEEWLQITDAPDLNRMSRKFTNPEIKDGFDKTNMAVVDDMEYTLQVLKFQIAELHRMRGKQLEDEYRYFGIDSETGNRWYNFDPLTNLNCGISCMTDNEDDISELDWSFLGDLLEDGRIYE